MNTENQHFNLPDHNKCQIQSFSGPFADFPGSMLTLYFQGNVPEHGCFEECNTCKQLFMNCAPVTVVRN